jgi:hypothetical protein
MRISEPSSPLRIKQAPGNYGPAWLARGSRAAKTLSPSTTHAHSLSYRHPCQNCALRDRALKRRDGHDCSWLRSLIVVERSSSFLSLHSLPHPLLSAVIRSLRFMQHRLCCFFDTYVNTITVSWCYSRQSSGQRKTPNLTSRTSICINDAAACKHDASPVRRYRATKALRI